METLESGCDPTLKLGNDIDNGPGDQHPPNPPSQMGETAKPKMSLPPLRGRVQTQGLTLANPTSKTTHVRLHLSPTFQLPVP